MNMRVNRPREILQITRDQNKAVVRQAYVEEGDLIQEKIEWGNKPKKCNIKVPILSPQANVSQAMMLQTETNNLLKHIISQNNKQINLLTKLLEK